VAPDQIRFRTRLEGLEKNWQEGTRDRSANYRYLPPGKYVFHVIASNNDGIWNTRGSRFAFTVLPYFWQTTWFRFASWFASALLVGGLVWLAARRRNAVRMAFIERAHALERERARIARDIHDDLGSGLTRIMLLSQSARAELGQDSPAAMEIENISRAAEGLSRSMDEVVWAVDPRQDTLEGLVGYITSTAQETLRTAGIRFRFEAPNVLPPWPLSAESRHGLFLAFKEALHNIIRHASAQTVRIIFRMETDSYSLTMEDDGKGFDPDSPGSRGGGGRGLGNMRERLAEMGGRCDIEKIPDGGTRVVFSIPGGTGSASLK
jgi:signal transduction histidine kinase